MGGINHQKRMVYHCYSHITVCYMHFVYSISMSCWLLAGHLSVAFSQPQRHSFPSDTGSSHWHRCWRTATNPKRLGKTHWKILVDFSGQWITLIYPVDLSCERLWVNSWNVVECFWMVLDPLLFPSRIKSTWDEEMSDLCQDHQWHLPFAHAGNHCPGAEKGHMFFGS